MTDTYLDEMPADFHRWAMRNAAQEQNIAEHAKGLSRVIRARLRDDEVARNRDEESPFYRDKLVRAYRCLEELLEQLEVSPDGVLKGLPYQEGWE